jgi:hypothetical protein
VRYAAAPRSFKPLLSLRKAESGQRIDVHPPWPSSQVLTGQFGHFDKIVG